MHSPSLFRISSGKHNEFANRCKCGDAIHACCHLSAKYLSDYIFYSFDVRRTVAFLYRIYPKINPSAIHPVDIPRDVHSIQSLVQYANAHCWSTSFVHSNKSFHLVRVPVTDTIWYDVATTAVEHTRSVLSNLILLTTPSRILIHSIFIRFEWRMIRWQFIADFLALQ